jgi:hypothetical protein
LELIYTGQTKTDDPKSVASFLASLGIRLDNLETEESDRQLESDRQNRDRSGELDRKIDDFKTLTREFIDKRGQEIEAVTHQQKTVNTVLNIKAEPNSQPKTQTNPDLNFEPELSSSEQNDVFTEPELNTELETDLTDQTSNSENTLDQETNSDFPIDVDIESNSNEETDNDFHMVIIFCNNNFAKMIL